MTKAESDFEALKILVAEACRDPANVGWYIGKAYWLGRGSTVDEALQPPVSAAPILKLVGEPDA